MQTRIALRFVSLVTILASMFSGCQRNEDPQVLPQEQGDPQLISFLIESGYDRDQIKYMDGYYLVDGDLAMDEETVREKLAACQTISGPNAKTNQRVVRTTDIVSWAEVGSITYRIDSRIPIGSWRAAIHAAVDKINAVEGCAVNLTKVLATDATADITFYNDENMPVECLRDLGSAYGGALTSKDDKPGYAIALNLSNTEVSQYEGAEVFTAIHELLHTLGLRHTNALNRPDGFVEGINSPCSGASGLNRLAGTPAVDPASIMNAPYNPDVAPNLSQYDILTLQKLYPDELPIVPQVSTYPGTNGFPYFKVDNIDPKACYILFNWGSNPSLINGYAAAKIFDPVTGNTDFGLGSGTYYRVAFINYKGDKIGAFSEVFIAQ